MADDAGLGPADSPKWRWDQLMNAFQDDKELRLVPPRESVLAPQWLKWSVGSKDGGPNVPALPDGYAVGLQVLQNNYYRTFYGVAVPTPELEAAMTPYYHNGARVLESLQTDQNPVAKRSSFERASATLRGVTTLLTSWAPPLREWRDKTGHTGDEMQGAGANALWKAIDSLAYGCENLVEQVSRKRHAADALAEYQALMQRMVLELDAAYDKWLGPISETYDTGLGFKVTAPGALLAWPGGAIKAIWDSPELRADFAAQRVDSTAKGVVVYPTSTKLGGDVNNAATWLNLEKAAKKVWEAHQVKALDGIVEIVVQKLTDGSAATRPFLPPVVKPVRFTLPSTGPGGPGTGTGGAPGTGGPNGAGGGAGGAVPPAPAPAPKVSIGGGGPFVPGFGPGGSGGPLKAPPGSHVAADGTVIGPDGKPVLGADGLPLIVPPGSRVNPNGTISGPKGGGRLDQKDRIRTPYEQPKVGSSSDPSSLERHLKSLRKPLSSPVIERNPSMPVTMSKSDLAASTRLGFDGAGRTTMSSNQPVSPLNLSSGGKPVVPTSGGPLPDGPKGTNNGGVPISPPGAGGAGGAGQGKGERDRDTWLAEDSTTWGTDPVVAPGVLGHRKRVRRRSGVTVGGGVNIGPMPGFEDFSVGQSSATS